MISGAHIILYSQDAEADRAFLRDTLGFSSVDAGHGWLIFALPPAELAVHPAEANGQHELYLMCNDLEAEISTLKANSVPCSEVQKREVGFDRQDHSSRWTRTGPLPAEAPDGTDPGTAFA